MILAFIAGVMLGSMSVLALLFLYILGYFKVNDVVVTLRTLLTESNIVKDKTEALVLEPMTEKEQEEYDNPDKASYLKQLHT